LQLICPEEGKKIPEQITVFNEVKTESSACRLKFVVETEDSAEASESMKRKCFRSSDCWWLVSLLPTWIICLFTEDE